ncbi:MAG: cupin domain-containing protein [bacterium]
MDIIERDKTKPFITKDGSEIRELLAHRNSAIRNQSLAEATVPIGGSTMEHHHPKTEEIYYLLQGKGQMKIGEESKEVAKGCAIAIPPGQPHKIRNTGNEPLVFLCCCAPCYEHTDTVIS